ncbi:MAG: NAD(P)/FAD-dependent oxidoreductase [Anaerococcus sp.]|jgi:thioredoxin reductase (NADPH)|nr:NAD(P)/FAD-dependent oxidoreductase [Peptoniphilaceae bacterium]MDY3055125.1 NAD(P)/FAD-dependent oxidoreductase [Anaerococcus sp.]
MRYDIAIIGQGPAGLSALVNARVRNKTVIVFGDDSKSLEKTSSIKNYLGFEDISGADLNQKFKDQANLYDYDKHDKKVSQVYAMGSYFAIEDENHDFIEAKTCILATGRVINKDIKNEDKFFAKGLSYCATCDAALYKQKKVVVLGYNEESIEEAKFTAEIVGELVFVNLYKKGLDLGDKIEVIEGVKPLEFKGENRAQSLVLDDGREIFADGFFIIKDSSKAERLVPSLKTDGIHVLVNKDMETNLKGLFAAGDITGDPYQISKAVGQGQVAALNAVKYIYALDKKQK